MNTKGFGFLRVDLVLQRIIGTIYIIVGVIGIVINQLLLIALIAQFFLGCWQVLSGIVLAVVRRDQNRVYYLLSVVGYFLIIGFGLYLTDQRIIPEMFLLGILGFLIIPLGFAIWYYRLTLKDYEAINNDRRIAPDFVRNMEDILDSEEMMGG